MGAAGRARRARPGLWSARGPGDPGAQALNVRIDTLYLGGGGPADPDRIRGVAMVGGHTISVRANATYYSSPTDQALPEQALQGRVRRWRWRSPTG